MEFYIYDFSEYAGQVTLMTPDYETEFCAYVDDCYNYDTEEWDDDAVRLSAETQLREHFGEDARIVWEVM